MKLPFADEFPNIFASKLVNDPSVFSEKDPSKSWQGSAQSALREMTAKPTQPRNLIFTSVSNESLTLACAGGASCAGGGMV